MLAISDAVKEAWLSPARQLSIRVKVDKTMYGSEDVSSLSFDSGSISGEVYQIGSTYMNSIQMVFPSIIETIKEDQEVIPELGILVNGSYVYTKLGHFFITEFNRDRNAKTTTVSASDKMLYMEGAYDSKLSYPKAYREVALEIANLAGVEVNQASFAALGATPIKKPVGYTFRQAIGLIAQFEGGFASFNRDGQLAIRRLAPTTFGVTPESYLLKGFTKNESSYRIGGISVRTGESENDVLHIGSKNGSQVELENKVMTQRLLEQTWDLVKTLNYFPYELKWRGCPALEAGDWVYVTDREGKRYSVPNLSYSLNFNGGLSAESKANTNSSSQATYKYRGTLQQKVDYLDSLLSSNNWNTNYYDQTQPQHPKEGDIWFKPNGQDTELWIYKNVDGVLQWVMEISTADNPELIEKIEQAAEQAKQAAEAADTAIESANDALNKANEAFDQSGQVLSEMAIVDEDQNKIYGWEDGAIDSVTGELVENGYFVRTDLIEIDIDKPYSFSLGKEATPYEVSVYLYDKDKNFIRFVGTSSQGAFSEGAFARLVAEKTELNEYVMVEGTDYKPYVGPANKLQVSKIVQSVHGLQITVTDIEKNAESQYTQLADMINMRVTKDDFESSYTQLADMISLRVEKDDLLSEINVQADKQIFRVGDNTLMITPETTYIQNGTIKTAAIADAAITTAKIKDASISSAKIIQLDAGKITTGELTGIVLRSAANGSLFQVRGNDLYMQKSNGDNLTMSTSGIFWYDKSGEILFQTSKKLTTSDIFGTAEWNAYLAAYNETRSVTYASALKGSGAIQDYDYVNHRAKGFYGQFLENNSGTPGTHLYLKPDGGAYVRVVSPSSLSAYRPVQAGAFFLNDSTSVGMDRGGDYVRVGHISGSWENIVLGNDGGGPRVGFKALYDRTYSSAANVIITSSNTLGRATSASKYKLAISSIPDAFDLGQRLLTIDPKGWFDKNETEAYAEEMTVGSSSTADKTTVRKHYGLIGEDLRAAGLDQYLAIRPETGEIEGIEYDRLWTVLIPVIRDLQERLIVQEIQIEKLNRSVS